MESGVASTGVAPPPRTSVWMRGALLVASMLALLALGGYWAGDLRLASLIEDAIPMAPRTALAFLFAAGAIAGLVRRRWPLAATLACVAILALALPRLVGPAWVDDLLGWMPPVEQSRFRGYPVGVMSPVTAGAFCLLAAGILYALHGKRRRADAGGAAGLGIALFGGTIVLGYLLRAPLLDRTAIIPVALSTGIGFVATGIATLSSNPDAWPLRAYRGDGIRQLLLRAFVPVVGGLAVIQACVVAWLGTQSFSALGTGFVAIAAVSTVTVAVASVARAISARIDEAQARRDAALREQRQATEALAESEDRFRVLLDAIPDLALVMLDGSGRITTWSRGAERVLGADESMRGQPLSRIVPDREAEPGRAAAVLEHARAHRRFHLEDQLLRFDGKRFWGELTAHDVPHGDRESIAVVVRDVTSRRELEEQLRQSQKLEAVGQLAGGVAHDFNNLLAVILACSDFLREDLRARQVPVEDVDEISHAAHRAAALTHQLLAFSRKQALQVRPLEVDEIVGGMEKMLRRLIGPPVTITTRLRSKALVHADRGQIEQVVMNLAVNARDAMADKGGSLIIETDRVDLDEDYVRGHLDVEPGRYAMIAVTDTGTGMDPEVRARIFEPFYTTKGIGKGTGLGLATVFGIVRQSGGTIQVYSEVGQGTTMKVYLPVRSRPTASILQDIPALETGGDERIAVVDDDDHVRRVTRRALERKGYRVTEFASPVLALEAVQRGLEIDVLLTDLLMPKMNGAELTAAVRRHRPGLPVVYTSGYTEIAVFEKALVEAGAVFVQKPFTGEAIVLAVRRAIQQAAASGASSASEPSGQSKTGDDLP